MKISNFLLSLLPLTAAASSIPQTGTISALEPASSAECCPFTYKPTCTKNLERVYHIKLFYNRKQGITPEQFNAYWANNHTKAVGDFHLRFGVYKYSQVSNSKLLLLTQANHIRSITLLLNFETFFASPVQLQCLSSMALRNSGFQLWRHFRLWDPTHSTEMSLRLMRTTSLIILP